MIYNDIYLSWSWRSDAHGYSEKRKSIQTGLRFLRYFLQVIWVFLASYCYIVIGTIK